MKNLLVGTFILLLSFASNANNESALSNSNGFISCSAKKDGMFINLILGSNKIQTREGETFLGASYKEVIYKDAIGLLKIQKDGETFKARYTGSFLLGTRSASFYGKKKYYLKKKLVKKNFNSTGYLALNQKINISNERDFNLVLEGTKIYKLNFKNLKVAGKFHNISLNCRLEKFFW